MNLTCASRDKVAICGYHGWHDWYLAANLGDEENLAGHLLPGLEPNGVPRSLRGTVLPFRYNDFAQLAAIVEDHEVPLIMAINDNCHLEGVRSSPHAQVR